MTPREFRAWFDGFNENMDGRPTAKQWEKICERVKQIDGEPITKIIYERYWPTYASPFLCGNTTLTGASSITAEYTSYYNAMADAGRLDFQEVAA